MCFCAYFAAIIMGSLSSLMGSLSLLNKKMYLPGGSVTLIVGQQGPGTEDIGASSARSEEPIKSAEFHMPTELLRATSPVFAAMLDGPWRESGAAAITIDTFPPDAFRDFLNCLLILNNDTARAGDPLIFNPSVIRRVLPIAHYYQVEALKQQIISSVEKVLQDCQNSKETEPQFVAAANVMFAVEASLPEADIPDWNPKTLRQLILLMLQLSNRYYGRNQPKLDSSIVVTGVISYRETHDLRLKDLSKKTLVKCLQSMNVEVQHTLPGFADSRGRAVEAVSWYGKLGSFELL
jgi:hypothetical protein